MGIPNVRVKPSHSSFLCQALADTLPACVGVCRRLFQTMYFTNNWLSRFLKISSKNYCHQARRQLSTKQRNMNVFVRTTKNTCLSGIVDQTFVVPHPGIAQISKFGFQKPQIHSSSFLLLVFFNPLLRYHAYVHQVPGKIINQAIELIRSLENW